MANLLGNDIGLNYKGLLNLDTTINIPLDGTLRVVTDGEGDSSPLYLSTTQVGVKATTDNNSIVAEFKTSANIKVLEILDRGSLIQYSRVDGTSKTFEFGFAGGFDAGAITLYKTNVAKVFLQVHDTSASYINVGGNLGINNTSPVAKLDIVAAAATVGLYVKGAASTDIARFYQSDGTTYGFAVGSDGSASFARTSITANKVRFGTYLEVTLNDSRLNVFAGGTGVGLDIYNNNNANKLFNFNDTTAGGNTTFVPLLFSGATSAYPMLKRSTTTLQVRLADDSDYATLHAKTYSVNGTAGFTGTGIFTSFTIEGGIITAAS